MDRSRHTRTRSVVRTMAAPSVPTVAIGLPAVVFALAALAFALAAAWTPATAQDRPLTADFPEVYRVGGLHAPEWAQFSLPGPLAFDGAGNLYHFEPQTSRVIVVSPDGELVMTVGRQGEGPGEFNLPMGLIVWRDGRFVVPDMGHGAYQVFGPDGELARYVRMGNQEGPLAAIQGFRLIVRPDPTGAGLIAQGMMRAVGDMFGGLGELLGFEEPAETEETGVDERGIERLDLSGDVVVTEPLVRGWSLPREDPGEGITLNDVQNPQRLADKVVEVFAGRPYLEPGFYWDVLPDGTIAYTDSSAYEVKLVGADGGPVIEVLRRPHQPEAVSRSMRASVIEREMRSLDEVDATLAGDPTSEILAGFMSAFGSASREELEKRPFYPEVSVVRGVRAGWDGALWIRRRGVEPWDDNGPIDVFGADRKYLGTYDPSETDMPVAFGPDGLVGFWELDELDVPSIVVKRLPVEVR